MTGVKADTDARRAIEMGQDGREVFKAMTDGSALTRRVLEKHHHLLPRARREGARDCLRDEPERILFAAARARPWVDHDSTQAERLRTIEFIDECRNRLFAQLRLRRGEIDQVAGVRDDRRDARSRRRAGET